MATRDTSDPIDYRDIRSDYAFTPEDESETRLIKWIIDHRLDEPERVCIILYAELGSLRKMVPYLGVSVATVYKTVKRVQRKIRSEVERAHREGWRI